jgi:hypothetical protein
MTIQEAIKKLGYKPIYCKLAKVLSVDTNARTCEVEYAQGGTDPEVRLQAKMQITGGMVIIPTVGSDVIIGFLSENMAFVIQYSEVDQIIINNGDFGGLPKIQELVNRINLLENDNNTLKQVLTTWVPVTSDGGAALKAEATTWAGSTLQNTTVSQIEDTKVTH